MNALPILSLPYVARINVYQYMGYIDLFDLSICSKRMKRILKCEFRKKELYIDMDLDTISTFGIENYRRTPKEKIIVSPSAEWNSDDVEQSRNIGNFKNVLSKGSTDRLNTYWSDPFTGAKTVFEELSDLFKMEILRLTVDMDVFKSNFKEVVGWLSSISHRTEVIVFDGYAYSFDDYKWILENFTSVKAVTFDMDPIDYPEELVMLNMTTKYVEFRYGSWIRWDHIKSNEFVSLSIKDAWLTGKELNEYLKSIGAGNHPYLHVAFFDFQMEPDIDEMLDGLNVIEDNGIRVDIRFDDGRICHLLISVFDEQFDIQITISNKNE